MTSNFLGTSSGPLRPTSLLSTAEVAAREGIVLQKSMNYRPSGPLLSVFLVLPESDGVFRDAWDAEKGIYSFEGHDSVTVEGGKEADQLLMYGSGKLSDNGKFYKAAHAPRRDPLQVQIYEKIDSGVWFGKGIFDLIDAREEMRENRKVFVYCLKPADWMAGFSSDPWSVERMLPAAEKAIVWQRDRGACAECGSENGLRYVVEGNSPARLLCPTHRGERARSGLLG